MKHLLAAASLSLSSCAAPAGPASPAPPAPSAPPAPAEASALGAFSISLAVKDLAASRSFYEALGFSAHVHPGGAPAGYGTSWVLLRAGGATIGLFQGAFEKNMLTFNPADVRAVQRGAQARGIAFTLAAPDGAGPAAAIAVDPDGNPVLLDQH